MKPITLIALGDAGLYKKKKLHRYELIITTQNFAYGTTRLTIMFYRNSPGGCSVTTYFTFPIWFKKKCRHKWTSNQTSWDNLRCDLCGNLVKEIMYQKK